MQRSRRRLDWTSTAAPWAASPASSPRANAGAPGDRPIELHRSQHRLEPAPRQLGQQGVDLARGPPSAICRHLFADVVREPAPKQRLASVALSIDSAGCARSAVRGPRRSTACAGCHQAAQPDPGERRRRSCACPACPWPTRPDPGRRTAGRGERPGCRPPSRTSHSVPARSAGSPARRRRSRNGQSGNSAMSAIPGAPCRPSSPFLGPTRLERHRERRARSSASASCASAARPSSGAHVRTGRSRRG